MKVLGIIIGFILIVLLGTFSVYACILSSKINKYEGYDRGELDE